MKTNKLICLAFAMAAVASLQITAEAQRLLVGDGRNDAVEGIDVTSGKFLGTFVHSSIDSEAYKIAGPRGLIFTGGVLLVANQDVNQPISGEILKFDALTGGFLGAFVPNSDPNAPFAPRGIVAGPDGSVFVADLGNFDTLHPGQVEKFAANGDFLGVLDTTGFGPGFYPRGVVFGPDGLLYVSVVGNLSAGDRGSGFIVRFDGQTGAYVDTFADSSSGLHRPEGLSFGPDGNLYVTSFLFGSDPDEILIFAPSGVLIGALPLYPAGALRVYAQTLLFGPGGDLFVPLNNNGVVRRYSAAANFASYTSLPTKGNALKQPWYMTFKATNPSTFAYQQ